MSGLTSQTTYDAGERKFTFSVILKNTSISAPAAGRIAWTLDADVTGAITSTNF